MSPIRQRVEETRESTEEVDSVAYSQERVLTQEQARAMELALDRARAARGVP